jgi:hypothetical protein
LVTPPHEGGRWTVRKIAKLVGVSPATAGRILRDMKVQSRGLGRFELSSCVPRRPLQSQARVLPHGRASLNTPSTTAVQ